MPRALWWSQGGRHFLMGEVPLKATFWGMFAGVRCLDTPDPVSGFEEGFLSENGRSRSRHDSSVQGYLVHEKMTPLRTLQNT